jgi:hypothetical protein
VTRKRGDADKRDDHVADIVGIGGIGTLHGCWCAIMSLSASGEVKDSSLQYYKKSPPCPCSPFSVDLKRFRLACLPPIKICKDAVSLYPRSRHCRAPCCRRPDRRRIGYPKVRLCHCRWRPDGSRRGQPIVRRSQW